jgi:hypothetical protein
MGRWRVRGLSRLLMLLMIEGKVDVMHDYNLIMNVHGITTIAHLQIDIVPTVVLTPTIP